MIGKGEELVVAITDIDACPTGIPVFGDGRGSATPTTPTRPSSRGAFKEFAVLEIRFGGAEPERRPEKAPRLGAPTIRLTD